MKTFIIIVSERFPKGHKSQGNKTKFIESINEGKKIHTIRKNFDLWNNRIKQIQEGEAVLSVRVWSGKPYASPQKEVCIINSENGISIQKASLEYGSFNVELNPGVYVVKSINDVAKNDGLSKKDFESWFPGNHIDLGIIHFTSFRY